MSVSPDGSSTVLFRVKPFLVRSIMLGVLIALFAGPIAVYSASAVRMIGADLPLSPDFGPRPTLDLTALDVGMASLMLLIVAPLVESLAFPAIHWLTRWLPARKATFVALIGILAFVAHGMTVVNITQAFGFMLMAAWYGYLHERYPSPKLTSPIKIPYYGVALAHFAWNATAVLVALTIAGTRLLGQ